MSGRVAAGQTSRSLTPLRTHETGGSLPGPTRLGDPRIPLLAEHTRAPPAGEGGTRLQSSTCERCTGSMAKWFKEHLGFKTTKAPPPAPPKPDYRHCHTGAPGAPGFQQASSGAAFPSPAQPDILAAYKLQKELDFEDPYTPGGNISFGPGSNAVGSPDIKYVSPKHRLIKVETIEKSSPAPGGGVAAVAQALSVKSPTSPPSDHDNKEKLIILEDYADPFDAEQAGGAPTTAEKVTTENDGYMEPYEAQKMMAEIRSGGRVPKEGPLRQLPLYDTPYEPAENGGDSDPERSRCPRESRLPQDDERPPEEYDQPWEWKKERISKAFAVQFDVVEKSRMSPTKDGKTRPLQRHSSGCLVNTKMTSLDHCSASLGERIDPTMPLESQFWYHGAISRTDAESLLRLCKEASYLVRNSETSKNDYSLSLKSSQGFMHMKLSRTKENKYILGQNSCPFDSVPEIIHFYSSRKLPIKGAEHMSLLYPVAIRTL
ncbi:SH2 domain-containing adapter protein F-like isoform X4 [Scophthalmus maximus]|uniref:SH2 domain-containing protein n=1 Tax=Scophthalmus maximus TaxID=52904 RepID=A0A8D3A6R4_SCOMX|nr:SH2 domain-containing adapter protein F-like isoform X4 [Scophthalmus maximus]